MAEVWMAQVPPYQSHFPVAKTQLHKSTGYQSPCRKSAGKRVAITPPPLALGLPLQGCEGRGFLFEPLGLDLAARADAPPLLHQEKAAEQVRLNAERIEAAHVPRRIDAAKFNGHRLPADGRESSGQIVGLAI
jgi:hypothetical protein